MSIEIQKVRVGVVGCGNISDTYLRNLPKFNCLEVIACADLDADLARSKARKYGIRDLTPTQLLADPAVELLLNLTVPNAHVEVSLAAIEAGKHVYSEKPLATTGGGARKILDAAARRGVRVGCAPDTFFGGAHQLTRELIDLGFIGRPVGGSLSLLSYGMEHWHPNPAFYYQPGGGPALDMGTYYITQLVNLLGPVRRLCSLGGRGSPKRLITSERLRGTSFDVNVDTTLNGALEMVSGACISFSASWDVSASVREPIEIYGTEKTLLAPEPDWFGGAVRLAGKQQGFEIIPMTQRFGQPNGLNAAGQPIANYRGIGIADMAYALRSGRPHRADGALALHVAEVLEAFVAAAQTRQVIDIKSSCERPAPLAQSAAESWLEVDDVGAFTTTERK